MTYDAIVIGGSFSGLSAALQLARARCRIAVIDSGLRRNRFARTSHGFLGQDGRPPADIVADAKAQLLAYPTVTWLDAAAASAEKTGNGFSVATRDQTLNARRLVLATGLVDDLPPLEGLAERWGKTVFHCPYCHGYELDRGRIGVLATSALSLHHALLLPDWGSVTLFLNQAFVPDADQAAALAERGVTVEAGPVRRLTGLATLELADGRQFDMDGLFTLGSTRLASEVPGQLGCALEDGPLGAFIRTGANQETTVPGVFACGDAARMFGNVALAVGDGALAGASTHQSLVFGQQGV